MGWGEQDKYPERILSHWVYQNTILRMSVFLSYLFKCHGTFHQKHNSPFPWIVLLILDVNSCFVKCSCHRRVLRETHCLFSPLSIQIKRCLVISEASQIIRSAHICFQPYLLEQFCDRGPNFAGSSSLAPTATSFPFSDNNTTGSSWNSFLERGRFFCLFIPMHRWRQDKAWFSF